MNNPSKGFLTNLAILTSKINHAVSSNHALHEASFARFDQLEPLIHSITHPGESLLIGQTRYNQILAVRKAPNRPELGNMLVVGRNGAGKGLLAIPQLLTYPESVIVNDLKGEHCKHTSGYRSTFSDVHVIDPRGYGNRFDPLAGNLTESELFAVARDLLHDPRETDGAIFAIRAAKMFMILSLAAQIEGYPKFPYVRQALIAGVKATAEHLQKISPNLATRFLTDPIEKAKRTHFDDKFLLHSFATLDAKLTPILTETVVTTLSGSDFKACDIIAGRRPVTVYLRWPEDELSALTPLVRLIIGTLVKGMIKTHTSLDGQGCRPVLVLADEAGRTPIPSLADDAATVRSRGIVLWVAVQDLSQLEHDTSYGKARTHSLINNSDTIIFFRPNDDQTAYRIERWLGRKSGMARSHHERQGHDPSKGESEQAVPLMTAQDIMQMKDTEIIVRHRNLPPILTARMDWRDFPELVSRRRVSPVTVEPIANLTRLPEFNENYDQPDRDGEQEQEQQQAFEPVSYENLSRVPRGTIWIDSRNKRGKPRRID